jgi:hypothetical protein
VDSAHAAICDNGQVRAPIRSIPRSIARWGTYASWLRWLDALAASLAAWAGIAVMAPRTSADARLVLAAALTVALALVPALRVRWRPVSGAVGLAVSRTLRPGDRAWYVSPGRVERVLVTGRRLLRVVIVTAAHDGSEGLSVRRTRVLLLPD